MKSKTDNETVKVHLTAEETFNAGRAAQVQGVATLGEFARRAMLEAAALVLEPAGVKDGKGAKVERGAV